MTLEEIFVRAKQEGLLLNNLMQTSDGSFWAEWRRQCSSPGTFGFSSAWGQTASIALLEAMTRSLPNPQTKRELESEVLNQILEEDKLS